MPIFPCTDFCKLLTVYAIQHTDWYKLSLEKKSTIWLAYIFFCIRRYKNYKNEIRQRQMQGGGGLFYSCRPPHHHHPPLKFCILFRQVIMKKSKCHWDWDINYQRFWNQSIEKAYLNVFSIFFTYCRRRAFSVVCRASCINIFFSTKNWQNSVCGIPRVRRQEIVN